MKNNSVENKTDEYIENAPKDVQSKLNELREVIRDVAVEATERTDYFQIPGYSYSGYDYYSGMFVWFSYKNSSVRLHVIPPVIENHKKELAEYQLTNSIVSFKIDQKLPMTLIKKLVKESLKTMKEMAMAKSSSE